MTLRWRFGLIAAIFLTVFSLYPQMKLWYVQGSAWQGNYAYNDLDEVAYASYVKALADGRPRKNDPYTGRDDSPQSPQKESLFSIQFAAPYTLAIPARVLGISTPWMTSVGGAVAALLTGLAVFWLLFMLTGSNWYAMTGSLVTLVGGAIFAGEGAIGEILFEGVSYPYFPGFRRYVPALAMPAFFGLVGLIWKLIATSDSVGSRYQREGRSFGSANSAFIFLIPVWLLFAYTVYSYFYIWTMAVAWLACLLICWLAARPLNYKGDVRTLVIVSLGFGILLLPYAYLLSQRSHMMDDVQLLVRTRAPDLARVPEYIAAAVLLIVAFGVSIRLVQLRARATLFVTSLALAVFAVFNQQVVTGQSLQPIHYQVFIGNYVAGLALVSAVGLFVRESVWPASVPARVAFAVLTLAAASWGFVECHYTVRVLDDANLARDEQMPVARRLTELAKNDPEPNKTVVYDIGIAEADDLPTVAPQAALWTRHMHIFTSITQQENKERYYQYLYYQGVRGAQLAYSMKHGDFISMIALFGWGRHTDRLNSDFKPLTYGEIDSEARTYDNYCSNFDPHNSPETVVSYLVVRDSDENDLTNFDQWYERDEGEQYGPFRLFRTKLKKDRQ